MESNLKALHANHYITRLVWDLTKNLNTLSPDCNIKKPQLFMSLLQQEWVDVLLNSCESVVFNILLHLCSDSGSALENVWDDRSLYSSVIFSEFHYISSLSWYYSFLIIIISHDPHFVNIKLHKRWNSSQIDAAGFSKRLDITNPLYGNFSDAYSNDMKMTGLLTTKVSNSITMFHMMC